MTKDMTQGNPLKLILAFAFPVFLGSVFQNLYSMVDSMIVGRFLGVDAFAAVGSTGTITFLVFGWITGLTSGFGILISQAFGYRDQKRMKHYIAMSTYLCIAFAVLMTVGLLCANAWILRLMNTPESIFSDTRIYIGIIYAGIPFTILYNMLAAIARAVGDSKTPVKFLVLASILNVILDLVFVLVIPLGVAGVALATVIAQMISAILCFRYEWKKYDEIHFNREEAAISWKNLGRLLAIGIPMALQFSVTAIGTMIVQSSLNLLGSTHIAAVSAAKKVQNFVEQFYASLGAAMATYAGQNYGARKHERINKGVNSCILIVAIFSGITMVLAYYIFPVLITIFTEDPKGELVRIAREVFHICLWFYFPLGLILVYRNVLQGLGNGIVPMLGGIYELFARGFVIFLFFEKYQFTAICLSDPAAWVGALVPLIPYYYWYINKIRKKSN